jgi:hypothetical protein
LITDIVLEPVGRAFDTEQLAAFLDQHPHAARDEVRADIFMLADNADVLAEAREERRRDPQRFPSSVILVELGPDRIEISYRTVRVAPARDFVE